jgi:hypothetical protein
MKSPIEGYLSLNDWIKSQITSLWQDRSSATTTPRSIDDHIEQAVNWLYVSQDITSTGGSAACYNLLLGWEGPYPETSGYIVPTLYDIAKEYDRSEARSRATRMAEWLLTVQLATGAFPAGTYTDGSHEPSVFNTGQILRGLTRAYEETEDERFRKSAQSAIEWLGDVQYDNGSWAIYDYNSLSHSYSSRISWPILEAIHKFDFDFGTRIASKNLQWVIEQQSTNGWFKKCAFKRDENPFLHTIAYTIRGLLESSVYLEGELAVKCERAATTAANKLQKKQLRDGILYGAFDADWNARGQYYCLTGNAQMAIIWARLQELESTNNYTRVVKETIEFLKQQQTCSGPEPIRGGVRGSAPVWGTYMYFRYPNWACKFFIDALLKARHLN